MRKKLREMNKSDKLKLGIVVVMLIFTLVFAALPMLNKHKEVTAEDLRSELKDTAWERKTEEGTEGRLFTMFGELLIGTLTDKGTLTKESCWMQYEITDSHTLYLTNHDDDTVKSHTRNKGDHEIYLVDENTIEIDGMKYKKADFEKWKNIGYDYEYWSQ